MQVIGKTKIYAKGIVKIPVAARRALKLSEGDELVVAVNNGKIELIPAKEFDPIELYSSTLGKVDEEEVITTSKKELALLLAGKNLE